MPDTAAYQQYIRSLIDYEKAGAVENKKEIVYFGTRHPFDDATILSSDWLVTPLAEGLRHAPPSTRCGRSPTSGHSHNARTIGDNARRQALVDVLTPADRRPPALFFTASHGMVWPNGDPRQLAAQGALLCQDWRGFGEIAPTTTWPRRRRGRRERRVSSRFLFACYGGGTPLEDRFAHERGRRRR